jgi:hypothetical protein
MWLVRRGGSNNPKRGAGKDVRSVTQSPQRTRAIADRTRVRFKAYPDKMFTNKHFIREAVYAAEQRSKSSVEFHLDQEGIELGEGECLTTEIRI